MDKYKLRMKFERSHFTDADNNVTGEITQDYAEYLENELLKAINYTRCSTQLKVKEIPNFFEFCCDTFKYVNKSYYCKQTGKNLTMEEMEVKYKQRLQKLLIV